MKEFAIVGSRGERLLVTLLDDFDKAEQPAPKTKKQSNHIKAIETTTAEDFPLSLKDILAPEDYWLEWSACKVDHDCLVRFLRSHGMSEAAITSLVPPRQKCLPLWSLMRRYLSRIILPESWSLQSVFMILFPQHPLVLTHHEALIDATKLYLVTKVLVQLFKPP